MFNGTRWCSGVQCNACGGAHVANIGQRAVQVCASFGVNNETRAAGFHVLLCHHIGCEHHEVCFEGNTAVLACSSNNVGAKSEIRHKLSVHDVPLNEVDTSRFKVAHSFA